MSSRKLQSSKEENNLNDLLFLPEKEDNTLKHYKQTLAINIHHFYIVDDIGAVDEFLDLINILKTSEQQDTIFIYLNTNGGVLSTAIQLISAMRQSAATIITCLEGEVCSAGTMIFLAGHKHIVNPNCTFMIHNYSGGIGGKGHEIVSHAAYRNEYIKTLMADVYQNFLSQEEINDVLAGKDIWLTSNQVIERLEHRNLLMDEENAKNFAEKLPELIGDTVKGKDVKCATSAKKAVKDVKKPLKAKPKKKLTK